MAAAVKLGQHRQLTAYVCFRAYWLTCKNGKQSLHKLRLNLLFGCTYSGGLCGGGGGDGDGEASLKRVAPKHMEVFANKVRDL